MIEASAFGRVKIGVEGLDSCLGGGFPDKTAILLSGKPGVGKTLFALNFLVTGAKEGERCCYISLRETPGELLRACERIEALAPARSFLGKNLVFISPELNIPREFQNLIETLKEYPPMERLVIDNLNKLFVCSGSDYDGEYWIKLMEVIRTLKEKVRCSLLIYEVDEGNRSAGVYESSECDGVLELSVFHLDEKPVRVLHVPKLRYAAFEPGFSKQLIIDDKGLRCLDDRV